MDESRDIEKGRMREEMDRDGGVLSLKIERKNGKIGEQGR